MEKKRTSKCQKGLPMVVGRVELVLFGYGSSQKRDISPSTPPPHNINRQSTDHFYRYKMPAITTKIEGRGNGIKTVIENCVAVAEALNRPPEYVAKHFGFELGAQVQMDAKNEKYIVNGSHTSQTLQDKLDIFIKNWILCELCENPETSLKVYGDKKNPDIDSNCKACGCTCTLKHVGRMRKYIQVNPPEKFGLSNKGTAEVKKLTKKAKNASGDSNKNKNEKEETKVQEVEVDLDDPEWGSISTAVDVDSRLDRYLLVLGVSTK